MLNRASNIVLQEMPSLFLLIEIKEFLFSCIVLEKYWYST